MASDSSASGYETPKPTGAIAKKRKYSQKYNKSWKMRKSSKSGYDVAEKVPHSPSAACVVSI